MQRRGFITLFGSTLTTWPVTAFPQQSLIRTIGVLIATAEDDPDSQARYQAFVQSLKNAGWVDGRNIRLESRWIGGDLERARIYASELVRLNPSVILANTAMALQPLRQLSPTPRIRL